MKKSEFDNKFALPTSPVNAWWITLRANFWIPLVLFALWPLAPFFEDPASKWHLNDYHGRIVLLIGLNIILAVSLQLINGISGQFSLGHAGFMAVGGYLAAYPTVTYAAEFKNPGPVALFFVALLAATVLAGAVFAGVFWLLGQTRRAHHNLPVLLMLAFFLWLVVDIESAFRAGQPHWYHVWTRFIGLVGTTFSAVLSGGQPLAHWVDGHLPRALLPPLTLLLALIGGGIMAGISGLVVGLPTLRLRGDYLAIATLGFAKIIEVVITNSTPLGKATGLSTAVYYIKPDPDDATVIPRFIFPWIYGGVILTIIAVWRVTHSAKGRAIKATREDEIAAASIGIDTTHHKIVAFIIGAFFAGIAGGLFAHYEGYLNPNSFGLLRSIELVVFVTIGGLGSIWGAVAAAILLTWLTEFLRNPADWLAFWLRPFGYESAEQLHLPAWLTRISEEIGEHRMVIFSLMLIIIMIARAGALKRLNPLAFFRRTPMPNSKS